MQDIHMFVTRRTIISKHEILRVKNRNSFSEYSGVIMKTPEETCYNMIECGLRAF